MDFKIDFRKIFGPAIDELFALGLTRTATFHGAVRPILQGHSKGDISKARALAIQALVSHLHVVRRYSETFLEEFDEQESFQPIKVRIGSRKVVPIGTAPGLDPDADALEPFSYLFGFQVPGPVVLHQEEPAPMCFFDDSIHGDIYLPQAIASKGLDYVVERIRCYREQGGTAVILPCLTPSLMPRTSPDSAIQQLESMLSALESLVDGYVWSPSWAGTKELMSEPELARAAQLMSAAAERKLNLVEMPPYDDQQRGKWLKLAEAFLANGGDGLVAVGGIPITAERIPAAARWPHGQAMMFGRSQAPYRQRAIEVARREFPTAFIAACGGIHDRGDAFKVYEHANVIVENEAFTRYGPGLSRVLLKAVTARLRVLHKRGEISSPELAGFQRSRWRDMPHDVRQANL